MSHFDSGNEIPWLWTALSLVPYDQRDTLRMAYGYDLSRGNIRQHLQEIPENLPHRQRRALLSLREMLREVEHLNAERKKRVEQSELQVLEATSYKGVFLDVEDALLKMDAREWRASFRNNWGAKRWLNTPGAIYCGQTDNCGTGHQEAPNNVCEDEDGSEIVYRQPVNQDELIEIILAAETDPFGAYGCDGNRHWNREALRQWWARRHELKLEIRRMKAARRWIPEAYDAWLAYLDGDALLYLRAYAVFLDAGRAPLEGEELPPL